MKLVGMDLHIHSALSPCGGPEMVPPKVFARAKQIGLEALVIADHNTAENQKAFLKCAKTMNIQALPGMEVQSKEDVHILCIFDTLDQALTLQKLVYDHLPPIKNKTEIFGEQVIVDDLGNKVAEEERLLLTGTNLSIDDIVINVREIGGLALPAHIDRPAFSLWSHLGFIPEYLGFVGVELTHHLPRNKEQIKYLEEKKLGIVMSSDAHWLNQLQRPYTWAYIEEFSVAELTLAIKGEKGRYLVYDKEKF
ncbi:MAG: PHP domain-containing protein [Peptococcales bacterium]|jgi:PHP family Zn ribbon phosphoesterase